MKSVLPSDLLKTNNRRASVLTAFALSGLLLSGCAAHPPSATSDAPTTITTHSDSTATPSHSTDIATAPIDGKVLFNVLAAELALAVDNVDLALGLYLTLLEDTQDVGVAKRVATIANQMGSFPDMAHAAELWLEAEPNNPSAHLALATSLYHMAHFDLMDEPVLRLMALAPDFPIETLFEPVQGGINDPLALDALFERLLVIQPNHAGLHLSSGIWHFSQSHWEDAKMAAQTSIKVQASVAAYALFGQTIARLDGPADGATATRKGLKQFPINRRLTVQFAQLSSQANQTPKAMPILESYYRQHPDDHPVVSLYARMALEIGEYETARRLYENLLPIPPTTDEALFFLGTIALDEDRPETAAAYFKQVSPSDYYEAALSALISTVVTESGLDAALAALTEAESAYPEQQLVYRERARLLAANNDFNGALTAVNLGLDRFADSTELRYARALLYDATGKQDLAIADLRAIILAEPDNVLALNALGYTLTNNNVQLDEAWALVQRAYALKPNDAAIIDSMGWIHYRRGELALAKSFLERAFDLSPDHEISAHLGEVLWYMGDTEGADTVWLKGLESTPGSTLILNTRQRLLEAQ